MNWLYHAGWLPGKSTLIVALELWHITGMSNQREVKLSTGKLGKWRISRESARRGLRRLERAGLVKVVRRPGCSPRVTLLEASPDN